jgi:hypothetical protein
MPKKLYENGPQWTEDTAELSARKKGSGADFSSDMKVGPHNSTPVKLYKPQAPLEQRIKAAKKKASRNTKPWGRAIGEHMPKKRDPTLMETLQREDVRESQLRSSTKKRLSPKQGLKKALKAQGLGQRGLPR